MKRNKADILGNTETVKSKIIGNNTIEFTTKDGKRVIRLHDTDIITYEINGDIRLNTNGWRTVTTKERFNRYLPAGIPVITQEKGIWYLGDYVFEDNMVVKANGEIIGADKRNGKKEKEIEALKKKISVYVSGFMDKLKKRKIPAPSGGDCWFCALKDKNGKTLGDISKGNNHISEHIKEKYYVPSLLMNAIDAFPVSKVAMGYIGYWMQMHHDDGGSWGVDIAERQIRSSLTRYMKRQFEIAA